MSAPKTEGQSIADALREACNNLTPEQRAEVHKLGMAVTEGKRLWCAACGKWGDHSSGTCPTCSTSNATTGPRALTASATFKENENNF